VITISWSDIPGALFDDFMSEKKTRLYHQAKKTNKWTNYKHFQKECTSQVRKAEWNYINDTIMEGLQNNNSKPFCKYKKNVHLR
jgi:hypothetical protein